MVKLYSFYTGSYLVVGVSIPLSGFLVVKRQRGRGGEAEGKGFNPFVGILGGQTVATIAALGAATVVSIPLSGFLVVKLQIRPGLPIFVSVSIPLSGFLVVKLGCTLKSSRHH